MVIKVKRLSRKKLRYLIKGLINKTLNKEEMVWCIEIAQEEKN